MDDTRTPNDLADRVSANARDLEGELEWLAQALKTRLSRYFATPSESPALPGELHPAPDLSRSHSPYAAFLRDHEISERERLVLALALCPSLRPQLLDVLWTRNDVTARPFAEFGGVPSAASAFLPTAETACFLLAGDFVHERLSASRLFDRDRPLERLDLLSLAAPSSAEPYLGGALQLSPRFLSLATRGEELPSEVDSTFPARRVNTQLSWDDLVLPHATLEQLEEVRAWLVHGAVLLEDWGMGRKLRAGYTCLFHGAPGTGKTLSACLLGKLCRREVYKVDLSMVVSKYIGDTEKNLARVFDRAERRGWLLFFDEADALFGKRTRVDDAHDRYANQEVSYLLQRVEEFEGVVILATNLKSNIDEAFLRRFQSVVHFPMPRAEERLRLWRESFSPKAAFDPGLDLPRIAERHELSGGTIINVVRYASLKAIARGDGRIRPDEVEEGIRRELLKEGRAF